VVLLTAVTVLADVFKQKRLVATVDADGVQRVAMTGGEYYFDPNVIVVKVNVPVEIDIKKTGSFTPHNIVLHAPDAGIDFSVSLATEPEIIKFTPTEIGTYPFECTKRFLFFKSHEERGMHGMIEVVE
jgi:plastocyanin domain-containing protein